MKYIRQIFDDLYYVGVNDRRLELFENQFPIKKGVSYNSYLLLDEKTVLFDTVDSSQTNRFIKNIESVLDTRELDYLIINHMEPDHAASIKAVIQKYPNVTLIGNLKTFVMMEQFFHIDFKSHVVKEGDTFKSGAHEFTFLTAPMVHWPEVMVTYDLTTKALFSADAFGTFGALDGRLYADEYDFIKDFEDEARRYFTNIVGKYGAQTQNLLKKASGVEIKYIFPLHGPLWRKDLKYFIEKHDIWSSYKAENPDEILIAYASMYGNTETAVDILAARLSDLGKKVKVVNICNTDKSYLIADIFRVGNVVLACPTYNGQVYPAMNHLVLDMKELNVQNKNIWLIGNGSWAPTPVRKLTEIFEGMKNINIVDSLVIKSSLKDESDLDDFIESFK